MLAGGLLLVISGYVPGLWLTVAGSIAVVVGILFVLVGHRWSQAAQVVRAAGTADSQWIEEDTSETPIGPMSGAAPEELEEPAGPGPGLPAFPELPGPRTGPSFLAGTTAAAPSVEDELGEPTPWPAVVPPAVVAELPPVEPVAIPPLAPSTLPPELAWPALEPIPELTEPGLASPVQEEPLPVAAAEPTVVVPPTEPTTIVPRAPDPLGTPALVVPVLVVPVPPEHPATAEPERSPAFEPLPATEPRAWSLGPSLSFVPGTERGLAAPVAGGLLLEAMPAGHAPTPEVLLDEIERLRIQVDEASSPILVPGLSPLPHPTPADVRGLVTRVPEPPTVPSAYSSGGRCVGCGGPVTAGALGPTRCWSCDKVVCTTCFWRYGPGPGLHLCPACFGRGAGEPFAGVTISGGRRTAPASPRAWSFDEESQRGEGP
jgi:hypothetical protein